MLSKEQLLALLDKIAPSRQDGLSDAAFDAAVAAFCAGCPDPVRAHRLLFECLDPLTDAELVERALAMAPIRPAPAPAFAHAGEELLLDALAA